MKEERAGFNPAELPRKKNLRKKNLPARIVEQAGVPKDRVIELSRKRILIAHAWSMLFHLLSREGIGLFPAEDEDFLIYNNLLYGFCSIDIL